MSFRSGRGPPSAQNHDQSQSPYESRRRVLETKENPLNLVFLLRQEASVRMAVSVTHTVINKSIFFFFIKKNRWLERKLKSKPIGIKVKRSING